jgi:integrase
MQNWLRVYKYPEVEHTTYDRYECTAEHQIYPYIGNRPVGDVTSADIKKLLTDHMNKGLAFTTSKKAYSILKMYFKYLYQEGIINLNPMAIIDMTKKSNYLAAQGKEDKAQCDLVEVLTDEEIEKIRAEAFKKFDNGKPVYQQSAAYFLMLNTGVRAGEACGIINSDIDLENRVIHLQRGVKEVHVRENMENQGRLEVQVGKLKSATSKRDIPLNDNAVEMIRLLQDEVYLGEDAPLIPDENGNFTNPRNMRNRFYRILNALGLEHKGLHTFRHTFATRLINGVKQADGTIKSMPVKQVADLLGHTTSEITEIYYVKRDNSRLMGLTDGFEL